MIRNSGKYMQKTATVCQLIAIEQIIAQDASWMKNIAIFIFHFTITMDNILNMFAQL